MKKGFLFGLGIFLSGVIFAVAIDDMSKSAYVAGDSLPADDFNVVLGVLNGIQNDGNGNIGIGGAPSEGMKLTVNGAMKITNLPVCGEGDTCLPLAHKDGQLMMDPYVWQKSGNNVSYSAGNVGIGGSVSGDEKLQVKGQIAVLGSQAEGVTLGDNYAVTKAYVDRVCGE